MDFEYQIKTLQVVIPNRVYPLVVCNAKRNDSANNKHYSYQLYFKPIREL